MNKRGINWFTKQYPQNYIIRKPFYGAILGFLITFGFMMLYRPLDPNDQKILGYEGAMAVYCFLACFTFCAIILLLKKVPFFSNKSNWSLIKELLVLFIGLPSMSLIVHIAGFIIEEGNPNIHDSLKNTSLIGAIPFIIFSVSNLSYLIREDRIFDQTQAQENERDKPVEKKINIVSKLKNENLDFYPNQFLYAESEGNYVVFYIKTDNKIKKETIRNSISDIENQFSNIPFFFRTHRAFIVNLKKVTKKSGNTLGYKIKLNGIENEIPVSRQNTRDFNKLMEQYH